MQEEIGQPSAGLVSGKQKETSLEKRQKPVFYLGVGDYASADPGGGGKSRTSAGLYRNCRMWPALAACPEERLLKLWEGLGYYNRVPQYAEGGGDGNGAVRRDSAGG